LQSLFGTYGGNSSGNGDNNYGRYSNAKMDQLIDKIRVENDLKKRDEFIREALLLANTDLPVIPIHQQLWPWAMRKGASAILPPNNVPYFFRFSLK
jgi:peptide/nickel transport system substrate-binding protein